MYRIIGADGQQYGPVTVEQLRQWITEGRVNAQTKVQMEGGTGWQQLSELAEFASLSPASTATPPLANQPRPQVPNYLVQAILCTIFCCLPFGIVGIVFAAQVNSKLQAGDVTGAWESSRKAKTWCWLAFWLGLIPMIIWIVVMAIGAGGGLLHMR